MSDPNSIEAYAARRAALDSVRTPQLVADRTEYLCRLARGRVVLDVGIVEHDIRASGSSTWLHGNLRKHARTLLGVDVLADEIAELQARGFNAICHDITSTPIDRKFDVIIAGEVIEHLEAPGQFMENCRAMLERGGILCVTTPNPWQVNAVIRSCMRGPTFVDSTDHVCWYDPSTMFELGRRHGLTLTRYAGITGATPRSVAGRVLFALQPLMVKLGMRRETFAKSLIYELRRD